MIIKKIILTYIILFITLTVAAQKLSVGNMEILSMDTYASVYKRVDLNDTPCAMVRVSLPISGATFSGNVVGEVKRDGSDYLVYMPAGSKKLWVKHPNFHELEVVFGDYGIDRLQSLVTYRVTINVPQGNNAQQKMQTLNIKVTPSDATVLIDGDMVDGNSINVNIGTHKYNIAAKGYYPQEGSIEVKEGIPAKLVIELDRKLSSQSNTQVATVTPQVQPQSQSQSQSQSPIQQQTIANSFTPQTFTVKGVSFTMLPVEGGTFTMGATKEQKKPDSWEKPTHQVTLSSYYIGETEVTQALWQAVMGSNPSNNKGDQNPVEEVSWDDCQTFISKLNELTGKRFRLPSEAEWEFAARGGNKSQHTQYSGSSKIKDVAWYDGNSGTHPVKTKKSNELGIYDMSGNVYEWCQDWFGTYSSGAQTNPTGPSSGSYRVNRGGSWNYFAGGCRSSYRRCDVPGDRDYFLGLRLALSE